MGLSFSALHFVEEFSQEVQRLRKAAFRQELPRFLYHYTSFESVLAICNSRSLWATSLDSQENDPSELLAALGQISLQVSAARPSSAFTRLVFSKIPEQVMARRSWFFITCFCADRDSKFHWSNYGQFRLTFPTQEDSNESKTNLRCRDLKAELWLQPCLYSRKKQQLLICRTLEAAQKHLDQSVRGSFGGPWMNAMATSCARDIAQILLTFAVAFKDSKYASDKEWRMVCYPKFSLLSGAPKMADEDFEPQIAPQPLRHIELYVRSGIESMSYFPVRNEIPFSGVMQGSDSNAQSERDEINKLLRQSASCKFSCARRSHESHARSLLLRLWKNI